MKLHLGCGMDVRTGWINIDLEGAEQSLRNGETQFIRHNLASGIPKLDKCNRPIQNVELIYSSHFLEHLDDKEALKHLRDCFYALRPGGKLRMCIPAISDVFKNFSEGNWDYFKHINLTALGFSPYLQSKMDYMSFAVYQFGEHKSLWDNEKVSIYLRQAGFASSGVRLNLPFDASIDQDNAVRRDYSFYVEAIK